MKFSAALKYGPEVANTTPTHKAAVLAVMAYLFDKCEIFEDAQTMGRHDSAIQASSAGSRATDYWIVCFDLSRTPQDCLSAVGGAEQISPSLTTEIPAELPTTGSCLLLIFCSPLEPSNSKAALWHGGQLDSSCFSIAAQF